MLTESGGNHIFKNMTNGLQPIMNQIKVPLVLQEEIWATGGS